MVQSGDIIRSEKVKEYTVRRLCRDNLQDIAQLHNEVYSVSVSADYFLKKYNTLYTGVEYAGFIAYNQDDLPIAYYGVIPCFIQYGDTLMLAAQSADTMTHPLYRFKGMFVELSQLTFNLCREMGIRLLFGFPNDHSYHGAVNKLGWKLTERMDCFQIPVNTLPLPGKFKIICKLYNQYRKFILRKYKIAGQGLPNEMIAEGFAGVWRGDDYLEYKSYSRTWILQTGNVKLWMSDKHGCLPGDIAGLNQLNFAGFIDKIKTIGRRLCIRQWQFHCSPGTKMHSLFSERFEKTPSYPVLVQDFGSVIPPEKIKFSFADIDVF